MRRWLLRVVRARCIRDLAGGGFTGSRADSVRGAGALDVVIGPPEIDSSAARGTRRSRPNATTGSPSRPPVFRQTLASSYAAVRPIRKTRAASSTVRKSGWSGAMGGIGLRPVASYEHLHKALRRAPNQHNSSRTLPPARSGLADTNRHRCAREGRPDAPSSVRDGRGIDTRHRGRGKDPTVEGWGHAPRVVVERAPVDLRRRVGSSGGNAPWVSAAPSFDLPL
jgi:hypothetical protein